MKRVLPAALSFLLVGLLAGPALAQAPATASPLPDMKTFAGSAEVQALIAKARAMPPKSLISQPLMSLGAYRAVLEYRTGAPAAPFVHLKDIELIYVIEGAGTLVSGGTLADPKPVGAANLNGSSITGGSPQHMAAGDFALVPQNTPHQMVPDSGGAFVLMTFHVPGPAPAGWP